MNQSSASNLFSGYKKRLAVFLCAAAAFSLFQYFGNATMGYIHSRSLFYWWGIQWFDPAAETQHGALIALMAAWLFWRNLRRDPATATLDDGCDRSALIAMLAGIGLHLAGFAIQQTRISIAAFLLVLWGLLAFAGGRRWGRAAVFPLGFALLAVPISFVDTLGFQLRLAVAGETADLTRLLGIDVIRNGTQLSSPDGHFQYDVAPACSGIRSLVALVALALVIGYTQLRAWFPRLALAAACLPFVVVGNIGRVVFVVVAAEKFGREPGGRLHDISGYFSFAVILTLLLGMLALLHRVGCRGMNDTETPSPSLPPAPAARVPVWGVAAAVILATTVVAGSTALLDRVQNRQVAGIRLDEDGSGPARLPSFIGTEWIGRTVDVSAVEKEVLPPDTGYSRKNYIRISDPKQQVFLSVVLSGRDRTSIHRPELCLAGQGWTVTKRTQHEFITGAGPIVATLLEIEHAGRNGEKIRSLLAYWFVGGSSVETSHFDMQARDMADRLRHFRADRWAYVVVQAVLTQGGEVEPLANMQEVVAQVWPGMKQP